jgi:phage tail sheath gpL-like
VIGFSLVPSAAIASGVFVEQENIRTGVGGLVIPQKIALFGQYNAGKSPVDYTPRQIFSADEAAQLYGIGSMLHLMARKTFMGSGTVEVYACPIPADGGATASAGSITVSGVATSGGTIALFIGGQKVSVKVTLGDSANSIASAISNAIAAAVNTPVLPTPSGAVVSLAVKWAGETGDQVSLKQDVDDGDSLKEPTGISLALSQPTGGATDPDPSDAFEALGATFFTQIAFPYTSATPLAALNAYWTARVAPEVKKPFIAFIGTTALRADYLAGLAARNSPSETYVHAEDSPNMAFEVAASCVGVCARSAAANPARPWKTLTLPGIRSGGRPAFTYTEHDAIQRAGGGTTDGNLDGSVVIHDLVTTYKTNSLGAADDAWRYPETIANIQAKVYSLDNLFSGKPFDRGIVITDSTVTGISYAISPRRVKAYVHQLIDELWIPQLWSKERDAIMDSIVCEIDSGNAGRINIQLTDNLAAGLRVVAILYQWAFAAAS